MYLIIALTSTKVREREMENAKKDQREETKKNYHPLSTDLFGKTECLGDWQEAQVFNWDMIRIFETRSRNTNR